MSTQLPFIPIIIIIIITIVITITTTTTEQTKMCFYYSKTDFGGCCHSDPTQDVLHKRQLATRYCADFVFKWAKATSDAMENAQTFEHMDSIQGFGFEVRLGLEACPSNVYDDSAALNATGNLANVVEFYTQEPVCYSCNEKYNALQLEWRMLLRLGRNIGVNMVRNLYRNYTNLKNSLVVPGTLINLDLITADRLMDVDDYRNAIFTQAPKDNVLYNQQWGCLRAFQRILFLNFLVYKPLPIWSDYPTMFNGSITEELWLGTNRQLDFLLMAQGMDHADSTSVEHPINPATLDLSIGIPVLAPIRDEAEVAAWPTLHSRVSADDLYALDVTNQFDSINATVDSFPGSYNV